MKTDLYTKVILTIIAFALTIIAVNQINLVPEAQAQSRSEMEAAISYCWDRAKIRKVNESEWMIHTYC